MVRFLLMGPGMRCSANRFLACSSFVAALVAATAAVAGEPREPIDDPAPGASASASSPSPAVAGQDAAVGSAPGSAPRAPSNDRLALGLGLGVVGSLHVDGDDGHTLGDGLAGSSTVVVHGEYGHVVADIVQPRRSVPRSGVVVR